ncbi:MAG: hypothetical protein E2O76_00495 [Caldithrix sp.]|nr:MAG: hypothetical protein E2O76_00495 [Caldithrix sp.]
MGKIGDPQVRNRGTMGGSLAHADPAADYPALILALNAEIHVEGKSGSRTIVADDFFTELFETALKDDEMITKVSFPVVGQGVGAAYEKFPHPALQSLASQRWSRWMVENELPPELA